MSETDKAALAKEAAELAEINQKPLLTRLGYFTKRTGPGWLQAAITLGGGSLAGSLFLGVILQYNLMWLQPMAMILGVIMLSAIGYVTLSSGRRPFGAINEHVSPVLGWAWLIAAMMANIVWCLPQFALGTGAVQQNLIPSLEGSTSGPWVIGGVLFVLASLVVRAYDRNSGGVKLFELILKILVGIVVVSFFLVVGKLTTSGALDWGAIFKGFIPNFSYLSRPAPLIQDAVDATGAHSGSWLSYVASTQKDKIIAAFGTAVGINMTFLLPYSMLRKSWGKEHRGLAIFDLSTGLIIPFMLATGCIVIAAGSQFYGKYDDIIKADGTVIEGKEGGFNSVADAFVKTEFAEQLTGLDPEAAATRIEQLRAAGFRAGISRIRWTLDPRTTYVVVDVETTGGRGENHRVTEIGAVKVRNGEVVDRFATLINPQRTIPPSITRLTGISADMVADAPYFSDVADSFSEFLSGSIFVAHNVDFDYGFIAREFRRLGRPFRYPKLCTCASMRRLYPGQRSYSLNALCSAFDIPLKNHHRALCDAEAAAELLLLINEKRAERLADAAA